MSLKQSLNRVLDIDNLLKFAPGVLLGIWEGDEQIAMENIGACDIFTRKPIHKDMHFRVGSITKMFTATVVLYLAKKGYIDPSMTAYHYFSKCKSRYSWLKYLPKEITIEQLGNMTSGLYNYTENPKFLKLLTENPSYEFTDMNSMLSEYALNCTTQNYFPPGKGWYYSNTNYILLGLLAEQVSGLSLEELYKRIVFDRLELKETSVAKGLELPCSYSQGYMFGYQDDHPPESVLRQVTNDNPSWSNSAGYLISTLEDLRRFIKPYVTGSLIGREMKKYRDTTFVDMMLGEYGFGILNHEGWLGHNGQISGYQSCVFYSPKKDITFIVLTNLYSELSGQGPANNVAKLVIAALD